MVSRDRGIGPQMQKGSGSVQGSPAFRPSGSAAVTVGEAEG